MINAKRERRLVRETPVLILVARSIG
jgi:hypothetical protein